MNGNFKETMYKMWQSTFSNVIIFETHDPRRTLELLNLYLARIMRPWNLDIEDVEPQIAKLQKQKRNLTKEEKKKIDQEIEKIQNTATQILHYDTWEGLRVNRKRPSIEGGPLELELKQDIPEEVDFKDSPKWEDFSESESGENERSLGIGNILGKKAGTSVERALRKIDAELKQRRTVAFITGIISHGQDKDLKTLTHAVNNWCNNLDIMETKSIVIIVTSNRSILPERTVENCILVKPPPSTEKERFDLLSELAKKFPPTCDIQELVEVTRGLTLHQVMTSACMSINSYKTLQLKPFMDGKTDRINKTGILRIQQPMYGFERVGGYKAVKTYIRKGFINVLKKRELAKQLSAELTRGMMLFGMWGTGKSLLVEAIAYETGLPLVILDPGSIFNRFVGESERQMREIIDTIEAISPVLVHIPEVDQLGQRGPQGDSGVSSRVFGYLLNYLGDQKRKSIIVADTNNILSLDQAFLRAGRFSVIAPMLLPDFEARIKIFEIHLTVKRHPELRFESDLKDALREFASRTEASTGAEIEDTVEKTIINVLDEDRAYITEEDILHTIKSYHVDVKARMALQGEYIQTAQLVCRDSVFIEELQKEHSFKREEVLGMIQ